MKPPVLQPYGRSAKEMTDSGGLAPIHATFDAAGADVDLAGQRYVLTFAPITGHLVKAVLGGLDGPGGVTIGVLACAAANFPAGLADITGGSDLVIVGGHYLVDTALAGWSPNLTEDDPVVIELKGVIDFTQVKLALLMAPGPAPVP